MDQAPDNSRRNTIILAVGLVILTILVMGSYVWYKMQSQKAAEIQASPSPSASSAAEDDVTVETVSRTPKTDPADATLTTYTIRFRVVSPETQKEVTIEEEVEAGQQYVEDSATPHVATYDATTRHLQWHLKGVPPGYEGDLTYQAKKQ